MVAIDITRLRASRKWPRACSERTLLRALHEHAGDDLEAVGDAVLELLEQDRLLAKQVVLELLADPRVGDVGRGHDQPDIVGVEIIELAGVDHQAPADPADPRTRSIS